MPTLETLDLTVDNIRIAAIRQRNPQINDQPRMLCVHGWLDNANSFLPMMPYLPAFDLVAIDLPGNGYSAPLPGGYNLHELGYLIYRISAALQWSSCHLVGHSLGAGILPMLAVAHPPLAESLTLIEGCGALSEDACKLPERMVKAFNDRLDADRFSSRVFQTKEAAVEARLRAATMSPVSAKLIVDRQLETVKGGFRWRFDKRWRHASFQYQTEEQVEAVLSKIRSPTLTVLADKGYLVNRDNTATRLGCIKHLQTVTLAGHHHAHMDTPEPVAASINRFLQTAPALDG